MHSFPLQIETQPVKHLVPYSSRELSWPSEITVKMIQGLETASTKGSAVFHRCRTNRGRRGMNRWTVRGTLSPLITPEDLALEETARAPARSCYHLQREGLAHPLLTLYRWQHLLVFIWVLTMYQGDKRSILLRNSCVDCQGSSFFFTGNGQCSVFSIWVWFWLTPSGLDAATGSRIEESGWRKSLGCILLPKSPSLTSLFLELLYKFLLDFSLDGQSKVGVTIYLQRLLIGTVPDILTREEWEQGRTTLTYKTLCVCS